MKVIRTPLEDVLVIEPDVYKDSRGFFLEAYHREKYSEIGISQYFVQDNHSRSIRGTLRGLHAQLKRPQAKLVRVLAGEIFDVIVDIRRGSPTYKRWYGVTLSAANFLQCFVPAGYAHGFYVTSDFAEVEYKCTAPYDPSDELRLLWNDPAIGIAWPEGPRILSSKDEVGQPLSELEKILPVYRQNP